VPGTVLFTCTALFTCTTLFINTVLFTSTVREYRSSGSKSVKSIQQEGCLAKPILKLLLKTLRSGVQTMDLAGP
jgi:hypothetical protein